MKLSEPVNWINDPLLLDIEPTHINNWSTANSLLSQKPLASNEGHWYALVNKNTLKLNLFPILVRRIDFVREKNSDRILSRFPFLVLTEEEKDSINNKILLVAEITRDYFYRVINSKISAWRTRFETYLERGAMPYPLYRCAFEVLNLPVMKQEASVQIFESARGKRYAIPTQITPTLAYLCGVINGDGHLHPHWLRVVDETKEHIELLSHMFEKLFSDSGKIFQTGNAWNVELRSSSAVRLFNFLTDQTIQGAKYDSLREPILFKQMGEPFRNLYWRGVMDADGSFKQHISFGSVSETFVKEFHAYLHSIGIKSKVGLIGSYAFSLTIPAPYRLKFINQIGVSNPKKKTDMIELKHIRCQFKGLNQKNLVNGVYFNLLKISSLSISGMGNYLIKTRGKKSVKTRSHELGIATSLYSDYENDSRTLTLETMQKILQIDDLALLELLLKQPAILFQSSTSKRVKLPIFITSKIIEILSILEPTKNYVKILLTNAQIIDEIEQVFGVIVENNRINNRLVLNFCIKFGVYQKPKIQDLEFESTHDLLKENIPSGIKDSIKNPVDYLQNI